ncbi:hypothetical protein K501DRAFT_286890 [Backusella circina FSU 941]|nr:hypothetical protein K501DRAFT_286890 [Backusella circina FSU 941]
MPETVIMQCSDGTDPRGPLPACMPMEFSTWYEKQKIKNKKITWKQNQCHSHRSLFLKKNQGLYYWCFRYWWFLWFYC